MFFSLFVSFFVACFDYRLSAAQVDEETVPTTSTSSASAEIPAADAAGTEVEEENDTTGDTAVIEEPVEEDTDDEPVDPNQCEGFLIYEGFDRYEETETFMVFSLVGDSEIEVRQGETAKLQIAATASNCGDAIFTGLTGVLSTIDYNPASWVTSVEHGGINSTVSHLSGTAQFEPIDGYNVMSDEYDRQIFYTWDTEVTNPNTRGAMDEVYVNAATTEIFEFPFAATEYVPVGTIFDLYLIDPLWNDVGTGAEVWDTYYYLPSYDDNVVKVRVTIVE